MVLDLVTAFAPARPGEIAAGRFVLRPVRRSDAGLIAHWTADRRLAEATQSIPHPLPPGAAEAFVARAMAPGAQGLHWVMDGSAGAMSEVLGVVSLKPMEPAMRGGRQSEIASWVAPAFWNTGIASEALAALIAANPLGDATWFAEVFQDHPAVARVLTNQGFGYLGEAEAYSVARGVRVPTWTYVRRL